MIALIFHIMMNSNTLRIGASVMGGLIALAEPVLPFEALCTVLVLCDCYSAWCLARRVRKKYPDKTDKDTHKFKSSHFGRVLHTLLKIWVMILIAHLMTVYITGDLIDLAKVAAGAVCFWQLWSIIENETSCRETDDEGWAKFLKVIRKIFVDKTSRHFNVDLTEYEDKK